MIRLEIAAPCEPLTANQRLHHHVRAERTRNWRLRTAILARKLGPIPHAHVTYYVSHGDQHRKKRDAANWQNTVKACLDGCVDAGLIPEDDDRHIIGPDPRLGPVTDEFCLLLVFDPNCTCIECNDRFLNRGTA